MESAVALCVFYAKDQWQISNWPGEPSRYTRELVSGIPEFPSTGEWFAGNDGIYFVSKQGEHKAEEIDFFELRTRRIRTIYKLAKPSRDWIGGVAVSPDRSWLLYSHVGESLADWKAGTNLRVPPAMRH